ncbi:MAG: isoprenylcysteine carboxylmethyltransferase family protein [Hyphomicrobiales bacterium]
MWLHILILTLVTLQRVIELVIAHRNTRKIEARGGFEVGSNRWGFVVVLQVAWLAGLWYLVLAYLPVIDQPWIYAYVVLEATRGWIVAGLGSSWTTRLMVVPGENLPDEGFRSWIRYANYFVVAAEVFILPMAFGLIWYALAFGILNLMLLFWRMKSEEAALKPLREAPSPPEEPSEA